VQNIQISVFDISAQALVTEALMCFKKGQKSLGFSNFFGYAFALAWKKSSCSSACIFSL
jgi:hypothetical protein